MFGRALALLFCLSAAAALADRRELYVTGSASAAQLQLQDPAGGAVGASPFGLGAELGAFYGITNSIHVGGSASFSLTRDASFSGVSVRLDDGSQPRGALYQDAWSLTAGPYVHYRYDTGYDLAPIGRLGVSAGYVQYSRLQLIPDGRDFAIPFPDQSEFVFGARALLGAEYRFNDWMVASIAIGARHHFNSLWPWQFELPLTFGMIF